MRVAGFGGRSHGHGAAHTATSGPAEGRVTKCQGQGTAVRRSVDMTSPASSEGRGADDGYYGGTGRGATLIQGLTNLKVTSERYLVNYGTLGACKDAIFSFLFRSILSSD